MATKTPSGYMDCAHCPTGRTDLYGHFPDCRDCGDPTCPACEVPGSRQGDYDYCTDYGASYPTVQCLVCRDAAIDAQFDGCGGDPAMVEQRRQELQAQHAVVIRPILPPTAKDVQAGLTGGVNVTTMTLDAFKALYTTRAEQERAK